MSLIRATRSVVIACTIGLVVTGLALAQSPVGRPTVGPTQVEWPSVTQSALDLTVSGPEGFYLRQTFSPGQSVVFGIFDEQGDLRPAGPYAFEVRALPVLDEQTVEDLGSVRGPGGELSLSKSGKLPIPRIASGYFSIIDGAFEMEGTEEPVPGPTGENRLATKASVLTNGDGVIRNSLCVGFDCPDSPTFSDSTILLMENNTRVKFGDTSNAPFPNNDWEIEANSSLSGGANYLGFNDCGTADNDGGCATDLVFAVEAGARQNALYVESDGDVGMGTSNPVVNIHTVDGNTPTLRLEQDGSSGFAPQTWDVAGNETNFFIRDVTGGSTLPLRIRPGADSNSLFIDSDNDIGIGTASPEEAVHISRSGDVAFVLQDTGGSRWLFKNNTANGAFVVTADAGGGNAPFKVFPSVDENTLVVGTPGGAERVGINRSPGSISHPLHVGSDSTNGNGAHVTNGGVWTNGSSRESKKNISDLGADEAFDALSALAPVRFQYKGEPEEVYVGFIAEDVPELVAQGDRKTLSPMDIVAVLTKVVQEQQGMIASQRALIEGQKGELDELRRVVEELAGQR